MSPLLLARLQFLVTTVYHFFFVPLTLGLSILVAIMQTAWVRTGNEEWKRATKYWGKLFLINFALGVVTGIVMEFQFGMNWAEYSRFVGDIFGVPLAIEALLAFFMESTFLGVWIFGWDKLPKRVHLASIWLVAIGSNLSALWILIANSFMQEPVGFVINNGRAELTDFFALLGNPHVWVQWPHVFTAGLTTAGFFVLGISAWHLVRQENDLPMFRRSFRIASIVAIIGSIAVGVVGHNQAQHMVEVQPMKMAAAEALWDSEAPASMSLLTIGNEPERRDVFAIRVPGLLSLLAYNRFGGEVLGINQLQEQYVGEYGPGNYVPPVAISYWTFRIMVGAGFLMVALSLVTLYYVVKDSLEDRKRWLKLLTYAIALPYIANTTGWLLAEFGRQPWIVFGVMTVEEGLSATVPWGSILFSLVALTVVYGVLMAVDIWLLARYARNEAFGNPSDSAQDRPGGLLSGAPAS